MKAFCRATGKARHTTPGEAERARKKDQWKKGKLAIYHCRICGGYHLGRDRDLRLLQIESRQDAT